MIDPCKEIRDKYHKACKDLQYIIDEINKNETARPKVLDANEESPIYHGDLYTRKVKSQKEVEELQRELNKCEKEYNI